MRTATHVVVGEANLQITRRFDPRRSLSVGVRLLSMLLAIDLDCQTRGNTSKIRDMTSDRDLPSKLPPVETPATKLPPKKLLSGGFTFTQAPCDPDSWFHK
jgi:hypothetical protein